MVRKDRACIGIIAGHCKYGSHSRMDLIIDEKIYGDRHLRLQAHEPFVSTDLDCVQPATGYFLHGTG